MTKGLETCRLCLEERKNMRSVFDTYDNSVSYADIINTFMGRVMVLKDDITDKMCSYCKKKVIDTHEFWNLLEESTRKLYQNKHRIIFNNFKDIKIEELFDKKIEIDINLGKVKLEFMNGNDTVTYCNTTISKVEKADNNEQMLLQDFLNLQGDDHFDNYEVNCEGSEIDLEDMPLIKRKGKKKLITKKKRIRRKLVRVNHLSETLIPVLRDDIICKGFMIQKKNKNKNRRKPRSTICPHCGKFVGDASFYHHILTHTGERSYKCDLCPKTFLTNKSLKTHLKLRHPTPGLEYKCEHCIALFTNKHAIGRHMITHFGIKKYICDRCKEPFLLRSKLLRHMLVHQPKLVPCKQCSMSFRHVEQLRHHMRVHTGERPFHCELCAQPYSYKRDFVRHCMKKHGVFVKNRVDITVMNEEVLHKELKFMDNLIADLHGVVKYNKEFLNPFSGPSSIQAFNSIIEAIRNREIPVSRELLSSPLFNIDEPTEYIEETYEPTPLH